MLFVRNRLYDIGHLPAVMEQDGEKKWWRREEINAKAPWLGIESSWLSSPMLGCYHQSIFFFNHFVV